VCTVIVSVRPGRVLLAANRDERLDRAWDPPAAFWPGIAGGRDRAAGGTWMAVNRHGVVATVLNRLGTLGPADGKRSRGELPLLALAHPTARLAAQAIERTDAGQWRGFNMVLADPRGAVFVRGTGEGRPEARALPDGVWVVTAYDPNDLDSARTARHLPQFRAAPATPDAWAALLADNSGDAAEQLNVLPRGGFGTVSASVIVLAAGRPPDWRFAAGPPHTAAFAPVALPPP
jgi:uncharacterized protein with NRDE domain